MVRRVVDISGAAANAPAEAALAPAIYAKPLLSPTDALAAALRGQDIPTSRQLTPSEVLHACTHAHPSSHQCCRTSQFNHVILGAAYTHCPDAAVGYARSARKSSCHGLQDSALRLINTTAPAPPSGPAAPSAASYAGTLVAPQPAAPQLAPEAARPASRSAPSPAEQPAFSPAAAAPAGLAPQTLPASGPAPWQGTAPIAALAQLSGLVAHAAPASSVAAAPISAAGIAVAAVGGPLPAATAPVIAPCIPQWPMRTLQACRTAVKYVTPNTSECHMLPCHRTVC